VATDDIPAAVTDSARLAALDAYNILDTPAEDGFDDIVYIASQVCGTPISLVSLVQRDRQWFKAHLGFDNSETPISQSVCAYALTDSDLLIVPDLTQDPRTRNNTLVTPDDGIRFYAGAPLVTPQGQAIGSLCVIDNVARPEGLTETQANVLRKLAGQVMAQLELRKANKALAVVAIERASENASLRDREERSRRAEEAGRVGTFEVDVESGSMAVSAEFCRLFGLPVAPAHPASAVEELIFPEDVQLSSTSSSRADGSAVPDVEYRIHRRDDGRLRWIARRAEFATVAGQPLRMFGTVHDVTQRKMLQAQQEALLDIGDALRGLESRDEIVRAAAGIMGRTLGASRAGFGAVDPSAETILIAPDWCAPGVGGIAGEHRFQDYGSYVDDLSRGRAVVVEDVETDQRSASSAAALHGIGVKSMLNTPILERRRLAMVVFAHFDAPRSFAPEELVFVRNIGDLVQAALAQRRAEADQEVLNHELSHRLKNTLSMVQAIANQTLRPLTERGPVDAFEHRLQALSRAHDVLMQENWSAAPIRKAVLNVLQNFGDGERIAIAGPALQLGPRAILSLSLLLHELGTNAAKYGSLSNDSGRVTVDWRVDGDDQERELVIDWRESGGPPVHEPDRKGFGSKLIRMGLDGTGQVALHYLSSGFTAEIRAPLAQLQLP
jgi:PAS domain S-box-containing protein